MNTLKIDLENCFGIGKLCHTFDFSRNSISLIYAPNGTMKTSFAKTFDVISKNDPKNLPMDRVYKSRRSKHEILVDQNVINPENILVINSEDTGFDGSQKISNFLASRELKKEYDEIYKELNDKKNDFIKRLKTISKSTDCEKEILNTFQDISDTSIFEILLKLKDSLTEDYRKIDFKYNDVFDSKGKVSSFLDKYKDTLEEYIHNYQNVISNSKFFKATTGNTFGTYQANEILKSIADNSFFDAGHTFVLDDKTVINTSDELKELVEQELDSIINDSKLKVSFEKLDKLITNNVDLRAFHSVIDKNNLILVDLNDYQGFRKTVWISFLSEMKNDAELLADLFFQKKKELEEIIAKAKMESELWLSIVETFNARFFVPFKVILSNKQDVVLKQETANLEFQYSDRNDEPIKQDKNSLLSVLSKGEQRAYFILQFLFELEARKSNVETNLLILDDIADSFDYKNKFAIIEYINDLKNLENFRIIILTHNFDFYRTVASRLDLPRSSFYMATRNEQKEIFLKSGQYTKDVFAHLIEKFQDPEVFISLIAFVRNLIEYSDPQNCPDYLTLTSCLHLKEESDELSSNDILKIYANKISYLKDKEITFGNENIVKLIYRTADNISNDPHIDEVLLQNKIAIAIAIRLKAERYLISKIQGFNLININKNQTQELCKEYRKRYPSSKSISIINKVNLMTPENIHINAFMYEPLIDMSIQHLINLYKEVSELINTTDVDLVS
jgi:uncharacterized protein YktA (UPF0223 family)